MKSDITVPAVLVDRMTAQYSAGWNLSYAICATNVAAKTPSRTSEAIA